MAAKEVRSAYYRDWRKRNPDRAKEIQARYWLKKAAEANKGVNNDAESKNAASGSRPL